MTFSRGGSREEDPNAESTGDPPLLPPTAGADGAVGELRAGLIPSGSSTRQTTVMSGASIGARDKLEVQDELAFCWGGGAWLPSQKQRLLGQQHGVYGRGATPGQLQSFRSINGEEGLPALPLTAG
eukprot:RCo048644